MTQKTNESALSRDIFFGRKLIANRLLQRGHSFACAGVKNRRAHGNVNDRKHTLEKFRLISTDCRIVSNILCVRMDEQAAHSCGPGRRVSVHHIEQSSYKPRLQGCRAAHAHGIRTDNTTNEAYPP
jgi:hypothetical protein